VRTRWAVPECFHVACIQTDPLLNQYANIMINNGLSVSSICISDSKAAAVDKYESSTIHSKSLASLSTMTCFRSATTPNSQLASVIAKPSRRRWDIDSSFKRPPPSFSSVGPNPSHPVRSSPTSIPSKFDSPLGGIW